ncbi:transglutaminase-like cysteine peptidase [uncultured Sneathiella sp.]|uniref:transglutaminase-like cysteine peptidase n=1 Tax=uncultured Sneathiella sp. TaxID=879315 RepID=UPI0030EEE387|tara:strand:- start:29323 stop:30042 length:720 start_codon:yes stop_codon:yes gene_type:complete
MRRLMKYKMSLLAPLVAAVLLISLIAGETARAGITEKGLFGMIEISSDNLEALPRWQKVMESFPNLAAAATACDEKIEDCKSQQMTLWRTKIAELEREDKRIQMHGINRFLNGWKHTAGDASSGSDAEWIAPLEFLSNGGGSRDFAVMKYISLKELGFDPDSMRIVIANDVLRNETHGLLSVELRGKRYILDSINNTILDDYHINYYLPLYSVNETTRWAHIPQDYLIAQEASGSEKND